MLGLCNTFTSVSQPAVNRYKGTRSCVWDSTSDFLYNSSASSTNTVLGMNRISADTTYTQGETKMMGTRGNPYCTDWSIVLWVKFTNEDALESLFSQAEGANTGIELIKNTDNNLVIRLDDTDITGSTTLSNNTWYHIVVTFNDTTNDCIMYLNGSSEASNTNIDFDGFDSTNTAVYTWLGYSQNPADGFIGRMFEVAIYDKALSAANVTSLYNGGDVKDLRLHSTIGLPLYWFHMDNVGDLTTSTKMYNATHTITGSSHYLCYNHLIGTNITFVSDAPSS